MKILNDNLLINAFLVSFAGHCLLLGAPNIQFSRKIKGPKEITINLNIEKPALLPKIDIMGKEKKFKEINQPEQNPQTELQEQTETAKKPREQKVKINDPAKDAMLRYQDMIKQKIEEARKYPLWAKNQGIEGTVHLGFVVLSTGISQSIKIIRSSGSKILDEEAIASIKRSEPFPPIPKDIQISSVKIEVSIVFNLKGHS